VPPCEVEHTPERADDVDRRRALEQRGERRRVIAKPCDERVTKLRGQRIGFARRRRRDAARSDVVQRCIGRGRTRRIGKDAGVGDGIDIHRRIVALVRR
jgi:hypothetical protein